MSSNRMLTLYRVVVLHDTFEHLKITVEFAGSPGMTSEQVWRQSIIVLGLPTNEFKLESVACLGTVTV